MKKSSSTGRDWQSGKGKEAIQKKAKEENVGNVKWENEKSQSISARSPSRSMQISLEPLDKTWQICVSAKADGNYLMQN